MSQPRPNWAAFGEMVGDLKRSLENVGDTQKKLMRVTGTAWSDDRLVKAVVGPRGQLIELELDPRIYRKPNSKALSASILATVREAIEDVQRQSKEIMDELLPSDLRAMASPELTKLTQRHDAELITEGSEDDD
jgi:DNA-binding protein YbaB